MPVESAETVTVPGAVDAFCRLSADHGRLGLDAVLAPAIAAARDGVVVTPHHASTTCIAEDPGHDWAGAHAQIDGGAMDGFVRNAAGTTDGHFALSYYRRSDLPFEYWLARTFALEDRHFAPVASGTWPSRDFLLLGTNDGVRDTGFGYPDESTPTLLEALTRAGYTWAAYTDGDLLGGALGFDHDDPGCYCVRDLFARLDSGTLPNVAFVNGRAGIDDDHPPADVQAGETFLRYLYQHAVMSPQWPRLAIIWTYDEGGGFFDHLPPPDGCVARPLAKDAPYFERGVRIPLVVVSPYARPHHVSHAVEDHTAITRFIEVLFGLPALTARDANSTALLDLFDFSCTPPFAKPPAAPAAGIGGCTR